MRLCLKLGNGIMNIYIYIYIWIILEHPTRQASLKDILKVSENGISDLEITMNPSVKWLQIHLGMPTAQQRCFFPVASLASNPRASDHPEVSIAFCRGLCREPKIFNISTANLGDTKSYCACSSTAWRLFHISPT